MRGLLLRSILCLSAAALPARAQTVLFSEGFENGLANWSATGYWHLESDSDPCASQVAPFPEGNHCAYYGIASTCNYDDFPAPSNSGELTLLAPIALPAGAAAATLHCWTRHETEACGDSALFDLFNVEISTNGGASWTVVGSRCYAKFGPDDEWSPRGIDLGAYLGQSLLLRFRFDTVDFFFNDYRGAFVDRIELRLEAGQPFCASTCPCEGPFNWPSIGYGGMTGCTNSRSRFGELAGGGTPSVANDSVVLTASELSTRSVALFLQSDGHNAGSFNGDGRFCLTGAPLHLAVRAAPLGSVSLPGPGDPPLSVLGAVPAAGGTRHYQVVYRDPANWCTSATFNHTNGYTITWTP
jgi:hypothetical protein